MKNAVRNTRQALGMTQQALADQVNLARQSIISIEKGRFIPTVENALRIAAVLGVPVEELFWLTEQNP